MNIVSEVNEMNPDMVKDWKGVILLVILIGINLWMLRPTKRRKNRKIPDVTIKIPALYLDMLDPKNYRKKVGTYTLTKEELVSTGLTISRQKLEGDILLDYIFEETGTVGNHHAVVAKDEQGYFIQCNHTNGMSLYVDEDTKIEKDEIAIKENQIIFLGKQPIRFRMNEYDPTQKRKKTIKKILNMFSYFGKELTGSIGRKVRNSKKKTDDQSDWY